MRLTLLSALLPSLRLNCFYCTQGGLKLNQTWATQQETWASPGSDAATAPAPHLPLRKRVTCGLKLSKQRGVTGLERCSVLQHDPRRKEQHQSKGDLAEVGAAMCRLPAGSVGLQCAVATC